MIRRVDRAGAAEDIAPQVTPHVATPRRRGRRPAGQDTRGAILAAARAEFGSRGYDGTTLRGIARAAGVDPRLVHHYFSGKEEVFVAALDFPARPHDIVAAVLGPGPDGVGERLIRTVLRIWEQPGTRDRLAALLSAAVANEAGARLVREFVTREILARVAAELSVPDPELRASLAASHMVGIGLARYVVRVEPLASADVEDVVRLVAPTLQRYLADPG